MVHYSVGDRVFHRRADLYGEVLEVDGDHLVVKYEWPWDPKAPPQRVPLADVEPDLGAFEEPTAAPARPDRVWPFLVLAGLVVLEVALVIWLAPRR